VRKLWMLASTNIKKTKSATAILTVMFIIAALMLNAGLLVTSGYGSFFKQLKTELKTSDAYFMIPDGLYSDKVKTYFDESKHVKQVQQNDALLVGASIMSQGKATDFNILFQNMDVKRDITRWKYIGDYLPAEDMSVYVPDIFKAVSGYQLNDKIKLTYKDEQKNDQILEFTVKGYTEDVYFSSNDMGFLSFYLPAETYNKVAGILNTSYYHQHLVFTNLDNIANSSKMQSDLRGLMGLNSASLISGDPTTLFTVVDIGLCEMSRTMMAQMTSAMLVAFALILVIVCLLVVRFRIVNSIEDDMVKIGSLKSTGYTSRQIMLSILMQFGLIAGIGSILGIALSYPALPAVAAVFEQQSGLKWTQGFDGGVSFTAFAIILLIIAGISLLAARKVRKISPVNALRGASDSRKLGHNRLPLENTVGSLPVVLAFKSVLQGLKQSIMILSIVTVVAFFGAFGIIMYYNTTVDTTAFSEVPGIEICNAVANFNPQMDQTQAVAEIKSMDHVRKVQYVDEVMLSVGGTNVSAFVMADYAGKETRLVYKGRYPEQQGEVVLAGILAGRLNKKVGDTVSVQYGDKKENFTVVGLSNGSQMGGLNTSLLTADFQRLNPDFKPQSLNIYLDKDADAAAFVKALESKFEPNLLKGTVNFDKGIAEGRASYQNIVAIMGETMLVIMLLVVSLVLYFMIGSSVIRRKRQLGIQKALGFTTLQLMNQIAISFAVPVVLGMIAGSLLGAFYTNPVLSLTMQGMGIMKANFIVNPLWVSLFGVAAIAFSYLLSLGVTWRIRKISAYALVAE